MASLLMALVPICYLFLISWTSFTWNEHYHIERTFQHAIVVLLIAGVALLGLSKTKLVSKVDRIQPLDQRDQGKKDDESYAGLLSEEITEDIELAAKDWKSLLSQDDNSDHQSRRGWRVKAIVLVLSVFVRIILLRKVSEAPQCTISALEKTSLPIILAIYDFIQNPYRKTEQDERDTISNSAFEDAWDFVRYSRARYFPLTALLVTGLRFVSPPGYTSMAMCAGIAGQRQFTVMLQTFGAALDAFIIIILWQVLKPAKSIVTRIRLLSFISLASAALLIITSIAYLFLHPSSITHAFSLTSTFKSGSFVDGLALAVGLFCIGYLSKEFRAFAIVFITTFFAVMAPLLLNAMKERKSFPPQRQVLKVVGLSMLTLGFSFFLIVYRSAETVTRKSHVLRRVSLLWHLLLVAALAYGVTAFLMTKGYVGYHPVKLLMYKANTESSRWTIEASSSNSLQVAVKEYAARYHRLPPPNFDKWYAFAKQRGAIIIDNYDRINEDLMPFWGMEPAEIRRNSIAKFGGFTTLTINMGNTKGVEPFPVIPDDPLVDMIKSFSEWLPQMQIVINTGDEPQVSISNSQRSSLEAKVLKSLQQTRPVATGNWSDPSTMAWAAGPELALLAPLNPPLLPYSRWEEYVQSACGYSSPAKRHPHTSDKLCIRCITSYSLNQFIHNVTKSQDLCKQPDIHKISNFLASPATAPTTGYPADQLVPIFSKRKVQGYNDILFPYKGSFVETKPPMPDILTPFERKKDALFWLGDRPNTSGSSQLRPNSWQSMTEQRLVQLANKPGDEKVPFMLPLDKKAKKFMNAYVRLAPLTPQLRINANFSSAPDGEHCWSRSECEVQDEFFGLANEDSDTDVVRFKHRYLLTLDSSPTSQFIKDVSSNSAAVRGSIFTEWWHGRLTPWLHYIPLDIRLHGLHATMAYYMGLKGIVKGKVVKMENMKQDGKWIAEEGRKRVNEIMRKQDAEVYLFRLLLEWGRVVDDNRDSLGFTG